MTVAAYHFVMWFAPVMVAAVPAGMILVGLAMVVDSFRPRA